MVSSQHSIIHTSHHASIMSISDISSTSSSNSPSSPTSPGQDFPLMRLPAEIRHQIYRAAIPSLGINFFNVHSFPNDHEGANRSSSPPKLHLDLRRLSVEDDDDDVAKYDPSVWQVRLALRQTCREARTICAIPENKTIRLTMTIPKRGLFVYAGDLLLRSMTPMSGLDQMPPPEAVVHRRIEIHADDAVSFSVENCSFNLIFEEANISHVGRAAEEDEISMGWAYDPEFAGGVPIGIRRDLYCLNLARDDRETMRHIEEVTPALLKAVTGRSDGHNDHPANAFPPTGYVMFDDEVTSPSLALIRGYDASNSRMTFWDRWDDVYASIPSHGDWPWPSWQLVKMAPEKEQMRVRYLRSAQLMSPKRPV
ncbi:hypothetical protein BJ170DRAFT_367137 [Xylariales sp. AK1849]|nr:hypothetical protein BJ170DRAFT_367137 [Xylariales sp. AK1849]